MQVQFQVDQKDYATFLKRFYFQRDAKKRLFILAIISLVVGNTRQKGVAFDLSVFVAKTLVFALVVFCIGTLVPYIISVNKSKKALKPIPITNLRTLSIQAEGISIATGQENLFWRWETIKSADFIVGYIYISFFINKFYLIPLNSFPSNNEATNFLGAIKNNINKVKSYSKERKLHNLYRWGLIGFIQNFGAITGIILMAHGVSLKDKKLIFIGVACILFTIIFWLFIFLYYPFFPSKT